MEVCMTTYDQNNSELHEIEMGAHLNIDQEKIKAIMQIKLDYLKGALPMVDAKKALRDITNEVTAQEFAICEQYLQAYGVDDNTLAERMDEILEIFEGVLVVQKIELPKGHPIDTYLEEIKAIRKLLFKMSEQMTRKFILNEWLSLYDQLSQISVHFSRKQNQLYPALEEKGFDKPSKVMWTLENQIKDKMRTSKQFLNAGEAAAFLNEQVVLMQLVEDMMVKEEEILLPTALELINEDTFIKMRISDDEIGYCLIEKPPTFGVHNHEKERGENTSLLKDLALLLNKHGLNTFADDEQILDVSMGQLTLKQINLIFKHLQVDLSYVDENEIVKFYSDTKHRVFPRSAGVIGREVQNCHPRESVHMVEEIIRAFKNGEQEEAEFWLEMGDRFVYIIYNAVRDEKGNFRGILEMMQDVTHIRSLTGSQRLLSWQKNENIQPIEETEANALGISGETLIGDLVKQYPFVKNYLIRLSPKYAKLNNPLLFKTMSSVATVSAIAKRGDFETKDFIKRLVKEINLNLK